MAFCIPRDEAGKFLQALRAGRINPGALMDMSSKDRRAFFEGIVGKDIAPDVNALFESKLLLKDQKRGLVTWAKKVANISPPTRKALFDKINKLDRVLQPEDDQHFLADLAAQKLGTEVTPDEARKIMELSRNATDAREAKTDNLSGVSDDYLNAASDLKHYVASLKPVTAIASIGKNAGIIAQNHLLMNPSTPIKTTIGQLVNSIMDKATRRIGLQSMRGANPELVAKANKEAWQTFRNTGMNTASMESLDDSGRLGEKMRFDVPEGMLSTNKTLHGVESAVRGYARLTRKISIDWEHNYTFTKFYQKAFYDMLNIASTNVAKSDGLSGAALKNRAAEIFRDAARVQPETDVGALIRMEGQKQAARVTSTNETYVARLALGMKDALNRTVNGLGDALMPIAKIPANIIWNGIENAGVGIPMGVRDIFEGRAKIQSDNLQTRYEGMSQFAFGLQRIARTFGVLTAAAFFASLMKKQDFRPDNYGNHFVRIGNVWINMEYINAVSPALAGMMNVKAKGRGDDGVLEGVSHYTSGALQGLKSAPGIDELSHLVTSITNSNYTKGALKYANDFFSSRGIPSFITNLFRDRPIERLFFGAHGVETEQDVHRDTADAVRRRYQSGHGGAYGGRVAANNG